MKKMFPMRGYFARAKVFGFILIFLAAFSFFYFLWHLVQD